MESRVNRSDLSIDSNTTCTYCSSAKNVMLEYILLKGKTYLEVRRRNCRRCLRLFRGAGAWASKTCPPGWSSSCFCVFLPHCSRQSVICNVILQALRRTGITYFQLLVCPIFRPLCLGSLLALLLQKLPGIHRKGARRSGSLLQVLPRNPPVGQDGSAGLEPLQTHV